MNYLKKLNAFYQQIIFNPLSGSAVALWNTLMHFNNLSGWQKTFAVPASLIELKSGIKGTSFKRARDELQEKGYIRVTSRSGNQAAVYQMISQIRATYQVSSFTEIEEIQPHAAAAGAPLQIHPANDTEPPTQTGHPDPPIDIINESTNEPTENQTVDRESDGNTENNADHCADHKAGDIMDHSADPLVKPYITENKTKEKPNPTTTTNDAIRFYQDNFGVAGSYVAEDICHWINDLGETLVLDAMKRALEQQKTTWRYVKGILKAWAKKGITTVEQAAADEMAFRNRHNHQQPPRTQSDIIPAWFHEHKRKQELEKQQKSKSDALDSAEWQECERLLAKYSSKRNEKRKPGSC
ncbi:hypothetical protein GCM10007063_12220 [Lentibacillus kapialis]|uniref:DnaB/C C-terminal domain-containing protein n=1 Tax=Lentibacillus kapialis TaxID=340214 RepID=A0A917UW55_9BACI|nr:DnaD domain protein [Lentibacillus kapialis]GGJ91098.1 hypothetical protein GCM10007063_12220 [Lentibacillus kapialis]